MATQPEQLPFSQAIDFYRNKVKLPTSGWTDVWQQQHSHAFVIAGASSDALVEDMYNAIQEAKSEGGGYEDFKGRFEEIAAKHGWAYKGSPGWRSKVIYDTNIKQSYSAGRYQQMQAVKHLRPFWQYRHTTIEHPRLTHKAWDGMILPADDAWWDTHMPQNAWGCNCKVFSLSRVEAEREMKARGMDGPDKSPEIVWEERTVGRMGSNPRTIMTPQGIDPGFAYNPGKAYLEPHTVPPLEGYDAVLADRGTAWPTGFTPPALPRPTMLHPSAVLGADVRPEVAISDFLDVFGATMDEGAVFTDAAGVDIAITKALFQDGKGEFKWLTKPDKAERFRYINLLAMALIEPDEIWWAWEKDRSTKGRWRLKRRYLRSFEVDQTGEYAVVAFEWGRSGWSGSTGFVADQAQPENREAYFDKQRKGRLVFKK